MLVSVSCIVMTGCNGKTDKASDQPLTIESLNAEDRWKMVLSGIGVTMYISLFSGILGTLLGFGLCMQTILRDPDNRKDMKFCIEQADLTGETTVRIQWNGRQQDPMEYAEEIPAALIRSHAVDIKYISVEEGDYNNEIVVEML